MESIDCRIYYNDASYLAVVVFVVVGGGCGVCFLFLFLINIYSAVESTLLMLSSVKIVWLLNLWTAHSTTLSVMFF